jgi:hypothetical protein
VRNRGLVMATKLLADSLSSANKIIGEEDNGTSMDDGTWEMPKRTAALKRPSDQISSGPAKVKPNINTPNRFEPLRNTDNESDNGDKIPPIYLQNVELGQYKTLICVLKSLVGENFQCQATSKNGVTVYPSSSDAYRTLVGGLKEKNYNFHSFQLPREKAYRIVIRHLHPSTDVADIKAALEDLSFNVRSVVNVLQLGTRTPLPLFFVDLEPSKDNGKVFGVTALLHTRVKIEEPRTKADLLQCKNCLQFGHSRSYCHHPSRCARCGEQHETKFCGKADTEERTCILCQGNHSSLYRGCQIYKELRRKKYSSPQNRPSHGYLQGSPATTPAPTYPVGTTYTQRHASIVNTRRHTQSERATVPTPVHITSTLPPVSQPPERRTFNMPRISARDPRLSSVSYAQVLSHEHTHNVSHPTESSTLNHTNTDVNQSLQQTLNLFFTRFQDLLSPLITTLNLLINKLLA